MKTNHTPGPWLVNYDGSNFFIETDPLKSGESCYIGAISKNWNPRELKEIEANAKLMAAAPEMLQALKSILHAIDTAARTHTGISYSSIEDVEYAIKNATE